MSSNELAYWHHRSICVLVGWPSPIVAPETCYRLAHYRASTQSKPIRQTGEIVAPNMALPLPTNSCQRSNPPPTAPSPPRPSTRHAHGQTHARRPNSHSPARCTAIHPALRADAPSTPSPSPPAGPTADRETPAARNRGAPRRASSSAQRPVRPAPPGRPAAVPAASSHMPSSRHSASPDSAKRIPGPGSRRDSPVLFPEARGHRLRTQANETTHRRRSRPGPRRSPHPQSARRASGVLSMRKPMALPRRNSAPCATAYRTSAAT